MLFCFISAHLKSPTVFINRKLSDGAAQSICMNTTLKDCGAFFVSFPKFVTLLDWELKVKYRRRAPEVLGMYFSLSDSRCNNISFPFIEFPTWACLSRKTGAHHKEVSHSEVESGFVLFWKNEKGTACFMGVVLVMRRCHVMWMWYWGTFWRCGEENSGLLHNWKVKSLPGWLAWHEHSYTQSMSSSSTPSPFFPFSSDSDGEQHWLNPRTLTLSCS